MAQYRAGFTVCPLNLTSQAARNSPWRPVAQGRWLIEVSARLEVQLCEPPETAPIAGMALGGGSLIIESLKSGGFILAIIRSPS
ncbi:hypothetical protein CWI75_11410 [Kineobactrum sediminis]|uniref:Uncharacterized protein n=1 Tax=Kineobactrum sediminis TaxID=1905677 RepID=A0A2N5Y1V7_9GAMM|nr:hypothetical protein CWI75_11410 [Kineobactrum sediminis]